MWRAVAFAIALVLSACCMTPAAQAPAASPSPLLQRSELGSSFSYGRIYQNITPAELQSILRNAGWQDIQTVEAGFIIARPDGQPIGAYLNECFAGPENGCGALELTTFWPFDPAQAGGVRAVAERFEDEYGATPYTVVVSANRITFSSFVQVSYGATDHFIDMHISHFATAAENLETNLTGTPGFSPPR